MHVVITGASTGIGRSLAHAFAKGGHKISVVARRRALLDSLCEELSVEAQAIEADLGQSDDPIAWLRQAEASFGPTDVLVNNAGVSYVEPVEQIETARIETLFQVNLHTPVAAIHHVLPPMLGRGHGTIVNVTSNAAFQPAPYFSHYTASKGALGNFSEALRMEVKSRGVHVVTVYPGPIETPMGDRNWDLLDAGKLAKMTPIGQPEPLAALIVRAVEKKRARVIYPRFYAVGWYLPGIGRFVADHFLPKATGDRTPELR